MNNPWSQIIKADSIVIGTGWFLYAASWFFQVIKDGTTLSQGTLPGWEALRTALFLEGVSASPVTKVWMVTSALINFIMMASLSDAPSQVRRV